MRFVVDKVEMGQICLRVFRGFPIYIILSTCCSYQIDKLATPGNLTKQQCSFGNRGVVCTKVLSLFSPLKDLVQAVCEFSSSECSLGVLFCLAGKGKPDAATILQAR